MDEVQRRIKAEAIDTTAERMDERAAMKQQHREQLAAHDKVTKALEASSRMALRKHAAEKAKEKAE